MLDSPSFSSCAAASALRCLRFGAPAAAHPRGSGRGAETAPGAAADGGDVVEGHAWVGGEVAGRTNMVGHLDMCWRCRC